MRSLEESVQRLQSSECSAEERARALFRAKAMITQARSYWRIDGPLEIDDQLAVADSLELYFEDGDGPADSSIRSSLRSRSASRRASGSAG